MCVGVDVGVSVRGVSASVRGVSVRKVCACVCTVPVPYLAMWSLSTCLEGNAVTIDFIPSNHREGPPPMAHSVRP
jgi:hypothetical protein